MVHSVWAIGKVSRRAEIPFSAAARDEGPVMALAVDRSYSDHASKTWQPFALLPRHFTRVGIFMTSQDKKTAIS